MKTRAMNRRWEPWLFALVPLVFAACIDYTVETTVRTDGSGRRTEEMVVDEDADEDFTITPDQFRALMHISERDGWSHTRETRDNEKQHVFRRETAIAGLADWTKLDGRIRISGATPQGGDDRHAVVEFRNSVSLESGEDAGGHTYTFVETFYFAGLANAVLDHQVRRFSEGVESRFPGLDGATRSGLAGLARGGFAAAAEYGLYEKDEDERAEEFSGLVARLAGQAAGMLRGRKQDQRMAAADAPMTPEEASFEELLRSIMIDGSDDDLAFLESELPGARLAGNVALSLRLDLPGEVIESNAEKTDDGTLIWELSPWDAITSPVEVYAVVRLP